ncbi:MAG: ABC transporter ATP-binding protein [Rhodospirillaceae bacterium]
MTGRALSLETIGLTKRFGSFAALDDVSIKVRPGTFHALLGENGAGKSTLVKCIIGYYHADDGSVVIDDREVETANPRDAHALGIGMVYQHFTLVPGMTVAENLVMSRAHVPAVIDWRKERAALAGFMEKMPFTVPLDTPVHNLAAGEKQKVEVLKQLLLDRRLLILDEPTSVLTPQEADEVLGLLRGMVDDGRLTIVMITHKFREVLAFADEVSVLRRGRMVGGGHVKDLTTDQMASMMVGAERLTATAARDAAATAGPMLVVEGLSADDDTGAGAVEDVTLTVRRGEIVGIAGVSGNGQAELVQVLAGQRDATAGTVTVDGAPYRATRADMIRHDVRCLPEEPLRNACVGSMSVAENLSFRSFDQKPYAAGGWWINRGAIRAKARALIERTQIKTPSPEAPVGTLSGGNVQRTVLARELDGEVAVLIVANPCFGLDFAAVAEIRSRIVAARNRGAAVLLVSEDLDEIFELADRILVMFDGRIVHRTDAAAAEIAAIGRAMAGH